MFADYLPRWLGVFALCVFLIGCTSSQSEKFPDTDIVYQSSNFDSPSIGFVNADGSDNAVLQVDFYATEPIWSEDGKRLYFRQNPGDVGDVQPNYLAKLSSWREGGAVSTCGGNQPSVRAILPISNSTEVISLYGSYQLLSVDLNDCKQKTIYLDYAPEGHQDISRPSLSSDGKHILYTERDYSGLPPYKYSIVVLDIASGTKTRVGEGINAVLSPDNKMIAYTWFDGIYVMAADGSDPRRLVEYDASGHNDFENAPPAPRWSPDGEWLVYHKCMKGQDNCSFAEDYSIFKVEVATGVEIDIIDDGLFPFWRSR